MLTARREPCEVLSLLVRNGAGDAHLHQLRVADDGVERSPELVTHLGEELIFRRVRRLGDRPRLLRLAGCLLELCIRLLDFLRQRLRLVYLDLELGMRRGDFVDHAIEARSQTCDFVAARPAASRLGWRRCPTSFDPGVLTFRNALGGAGEVHERSRDVVADGPRGENASDQEDECEDPQPGEYGACPGDRGTLWELDRELPRRTAQRSLRGQHRGRLAVLSAVE